MHHAIVPGRMTISGTGMSSVRTCDVEFFRFRELTLDYTLFARESC